MDVIDGAFSALQRRVRSSADFESVQRAHNEFLATVTVNSFLRDRVSQDLQRPGAVPLVAVPS